MNPRGFPYDGGRTAVFTTATCTGRLIAIGLMLVGIAFVSFCTAAIAQRFIVPIVEENIARGHDDMTSVRPGWEFETVRHPHSPPPGRT